MALPTLKHMRFAFIGAGQMASHFLEPLLRNEIVSPENVVATQPDVAACEWVHRQFPNISVSMDNQKAAREADVIFLGVKPSDLSEVSQQIGRGNIQKDALLISFMAAVPMQSIYNSFGHRRICRCMPNTPVKIQRGVVPWAVSPEVTVDQKSVIRTMFGYLGREMELPKEAYVDMSTALSGSGPAYFFLMMEALADAGVHLGLPRHYAEEMVLATMAGSVDYARHMHNECTSFSTLKDAVTSPGGTAASALYVAEKNGLRSTLSDVVWAAYRRSLQLASGSNKIYGPGIYEPVENAAMHRFPPPDEFSQ